MSKPSRVLIINPFGIGDVLFTTPVIESLKADSGECRIGFLCNRRTEPVIRANPHIEWVFVYEKDEIRALWKESKPACVKRLISLVGEIKRAGFDAAIDLSLNREYGFICWLAGIKTRIGYNYRNRGTYLTRKVDIDGYGGKHIIEYYLELLESIGIRPSSRNISLYIPEDDRRWARQFLSSQGAGERGSFVAIAPGGGASWGKDAAIKHWGSSGFARVADWLIERHGVKIVILGSEPEKRICESVRTAMKNTAITACGKTTLLQSAALMSLCGLVIANDGGPLHMAVGAGTRTVGIFGPVDEKVYGQYPPDEKRHRVVKEDISCRPCYKNFKMKDCGLRRCLDSISPETVFKAAEEVLAAR